MHIILIYTALIKKIVLIFLVRKIYDFFFLLFNRDLFKYLRARCTLRNGNVT